MLRLVGQFTIRPDGLCLATNFLVLILRADNLLSSLSARCKLGTIGEFEKQFLF